MYIGLRMGRPLPWKYWRVWLCERMGWTLEYVSEMDLADAVETIEILQNRDLASAHNQRKAMMGRGKR